MANTGIIFGGDILLYHNTGTEVAPVWAAFAHATSHSLSESTNMREQAHKDDGGQTLVKPGRHAVGTISISGLTSYEGVDYFTMKDKRNKREKIQVKYSGRPAADTKFIDAKEASGDKYEEGYGYISEISREDPLDGDSTYSCTITLSGGTEIKTVT